MQIKQILLTGLCIALNVLNVAAQATVSIRGKIEDENGAPVVANISVSGINRRTLSDANGFYQLKADKGGKHTVIVSALGYHVFSKEIALKEGEDLQLNFRLKQDLRQIEQVTVAGRTKAEEVNRQAFNVTAIDAKKLYNTTLDISGALDRVAGVRVRESGGLGSNFNLSLNGFSGNHVRYFLDGIPMDNFGSSFQINNIPVNIAERIEVYKGVVPMWLGSDALGGAINIVTGNRFRNYLDASYSYGSFNTHRTVVNTAYTTKSGLTFQLNAFQNYSDNNYKVTVDAADLQTGVYAPNTVVRRFHDTYHNESLILNVGLLDKKFADKLLFGITLGQNYKEIQTGARMVSVFGAWHRRGSTFMPTLKYKKDNLIKGLDVTLNANYNIGYEQNIDTVNRRYDWYGNYIETGSSGERSRTLYKYRNNPVLVNSTANYKITEKQSVALSNVFTAFNRKGHDELNPNSTDFGQTRKNNKNILGLGYSYTVKDKWGLNLFGKFIHVRSEQGAASNSISTIQNKIGYGLAYSHFITKDLQLRSSYEHTNRMPDAEEIFGDAENMEGNANLKPEASNNVNIGLIYNFQLNANNRFSFTANGIYRYATDFIYYRLNNNQSKLVGDNREGVSTIGADGELRYSYKNWLSAGASVTYQFLQNLQKYDLDVYGVPYTEVSNSYLDQMPNIPYLFGNADIAVSIRNLGAKGNHLTLGGNLLFVNEFWLYWPSLGGRQETERKKGIPTQIAPDLNLVYSLKNGRYNIAFEARNITDARQFDNFSLQKPSRGFYLNLRYFIHKENK